MSKRLPPHKQLEALFEYQHNNPPAPFNPDYVPRTKAEEDAAHEAYREYSESLGFDMPEEEKRPLRAKFYREYWDAFVARKRGEG